ncbi:hypothetical protein WMF30_49970 [Sorangium sp. So ce134]
MRAITISDRDPTTGALDFDLRDLLSVIAADAGQLKWEVVSPDCVGARANELDELAARGVRVSGDLLLDIAEGIEQVIDGEFRAYETGKDSPVLVMRAVDSTSWDIASDNDELLRAFRYRFRSVIEAGDAY